MLFKEMMSNPHSRAPKAILFARVCHESLVSHRSGHFNLDPKIRTRNFINTFWV